MTSRTFVSYAGIDQPKVAEIIAGAPKVLFSIYTHDFINGQTLLSSMQDHVSHCSAFVFIASKSSISSVWCQHELARAEIETITHNIPIYVIIIDHDVSLNDLPHWMRAFWISPVGTRIPQLRRRFQLILESTLDATFSGEEVRAQAAHNAYLAHLANHHVAPNVLFFSGADGIGRATTARLLLKRIFHDTRFPVGPQIALEDPASIEILYISLQEQFNGLLGERYEQELVAFRHLDNSDKISTIVNLLEEISKGDETVFIRCKSGLFNENGDLLDWAKELISLCGERSRIRLVILSLRQPRSRESSTLLNMIHLSVTRLADVEVESLVRQLTLKAEGVALTPPPKSINAIGGHPVLAKHYSSSLVQYGTSAEQQAYYDLIITQKNMFAETLSYETLCEEEKSILAILSWVPSLDSDYLENICNEMQIPDYNFYLSSLTLSSLVDYYGGKYAICGPVRTVFRQLYGDGDNNFGSRLVDLLLPKLDDMSKISSESIDLLTYVLTMFGGDLSPEIKQIVSPVSILRSARAVYQTARDRVGQLGYDKVVKLCSAGIEITKEAAILNDFMRVKARAYMRMRKFPEADEIIKKIEANGDRQTLHLRAQYYRFKNDYAKATPLYKMAIDRGLTDSSILHEYCLCLRKLRQYPIVEEILTKYSNKVEANIYLLSTKSSLEMGAGAFRTAENTIDMMKRLPDNRETAAEKEAILIFKETQDVGKSLDILDAAIERIESSGAEPVPDLHATRCLIRAKAKMVNEAHSDLDIVRSSHRDGEYVSARLYLYILLARKRAVEALDLFSKMPGVTEADDLLKREILNNLMNDQSITITDRERYEEMYNDILIRRSKVTEFDF